MKFCPKRPARGSESSNHATMLKKAVITLFFASLATRATASSADTHSQQAAERVYGNLHSQSLAPMKAADQPSQLGSGSSKPTKQQALEKVYGNIHSNSVKPLNK
jgi:uncharacterized membrane protein